MIQPGQQQNLQGPGPVILPGQQQNLQGPGPAIQPGQQQNLQGPGPAIQPGQQQNFPGQGPGVVIPPWLIPGLPNIPNVPGIQQRLNVRVKSVFADGYVNAERNNFLHANTQNANRAPIFILIFLDRNRFRLRLQGGNFVRVDNDGFLVADTNTNRASIFSLFRTGDREFVMMAPNGNFVRVREDDNRLVARAQNAGPRTRFRFRQS